MIGFLFCCAWALLLAWKCRDKVSCKLRRHIVLPSLVLLVLLLNPLSAHVLVTQALETRSLRFFWLIPVALLLACTAVLLLGFVSGRGRKILVGAAVPLLLFAYGVPFHNLGNTWENETSNWYKIPQVVVDLCDVIMQDHTWSKKKAVFPDGVNHWVRQYQPEIRLAYAWNQTNWSLAPEWQLYNSLNVPETEPIDLDIVNQRGPEGGYTYVVLQGWREFTGELQCYEEIYRTQIDPRKAVDVNNNVYILYRLAAEG